MLGIRINKGFMTTVLVLLVVLDFYYSLYILNIILYFILFSARNIYIYIYSLKIIYIYKDFK